MNSQEQEPSKMPLNEQEAQDARGTHDTHDVQGAQAVTAKKNPRKEDDDFSALSKEDIVKELKRYIHDIPLEAHKNEVDLLVAAFYKRQQDEHDALKQQLIDEGGREEDFKPAKEELEKELKEWTAKYNVLKNEYFLRFEKEKKDNLAQRNAIIEKIKELVHGEESLHKTFDEFRSLQQQWREVGEVERSEQRLLYQNYNHAREMFYDYVKLNKELKDVDLKRNHDLKVVLYEKAKALLDEKDVFSAFKELQLLHEQWREIGPVETELKDVIWNQFRDVTREINTRHRTSIVGLQHKRKENIQARKDIIRQIAELSESDYNTAKAWQEKSDELNALQQQYREVGPVPKRSLGDLTDAYREACKQFFDKKKHFFSAYKDEQRENLEKKLKLVEQAEALQESKTWDETSQTLIDLQKKWKQIGPVPRSQSDKIWKRFRAACNTFFDARSKSITGEDGSFDENLKLKEQLLEEMTAFPYSDDATEDVKRLNELQSKWGAIGFVPNAKKQEVEAQYRKLVDAISDKLEVKPVQKKVLQYTAKLSSMGGKPGSNNQYKAEYERLQKMMRALQEEVKVLDNNLGFFKNSKNASQVIADFQKQIDAKREEMNLTKRKMDALNRME